MRNSRKNLSVIFLLFPVLLVGCGDDSTNPVDEKHYTIPDVINIVWTLAAYDTAGRKTDVSSYEPFHLVYDNDGFWGDDGCNTFTGTYEVRNDSIFPANFWITGTACGKNTFPAHHLQEPYGIVILDNELRISSGNSTSTYRSNFMQSIENSPLVGKVWKLTFSNDSIFEEIKTRQLVSTMVVDEKRTFEFDIEWNDGSMLVYAETYGVYGVGDGNAISFYVQGQDGHGDRAIRFSNTALKSSSYRVENNVLTLSNETEGTIFKFTAK